MCQNFGFTGATLGQGQPWRLQRVCGENDRVPGTCELMCYCHSQKAGAKHSVPPPSMPFLEVTQYIKRGFVLNHTPSIAPGASGSVQLEEVNRKCLPGPLSTADTASLEGSRLSCNAYENVKELKALVTKEPLQSELRYAESGFQQRWRCILFP